MSDMSFSPQDLGIAEEDWQQTPPSVQAAIGALQARIAKLEEQLGLNSENSSKPPSSDQPGHKREEQGKPPSGKKRGGQPGHKGHHRQRVPAEEVNEFRIYKPEGCAHCGEALTGEDATPYRWQVTELPPIKPLVVEHQVHSLCCASCGQTTRGKLPPEVARSQFGERLSAFLGLLMGQYRLSKRQVAGLMQDAFGVSIAPSSVVNRQTEISASLAEPVKEVAEQVKQAQRRNIDETSWREAAQGSQLWGVVTEAATLFRIVGSRSSAVAVELLGQTDSGVTTSDRWSAYNFLRGTRHQTCWAHLLRHFKRLALRDTASVRVGAMLVLYSEYLLHRWRQVRVGKLPRSDFLAEVPQHRHDVQTWLEQGTAVAHPQTAALCRGLLKHFEMLWTFTRYANVEPTNNAAERALRHGVIWRKLCYGTDSPGGSRFVERMLTVLATCRQQNHALLDFLQQSLVAQRHGRDAPRLLATQPLSSADYTP